MSDLENKVVSSLGEVVPNVDASALDPAKSFRDQFDFDSIDHLNFVMALQRASGIEIPELDYPQLAGLKAAIEYLSIHIKGYE